MCDAIKNRLTMASNFEMRTCSFGSLVPICSFSGQYPPHHVSFQKIIRFISQDNNSNLIWKVFFFFIYLSAPFVVLFALLRSTSPKPVLSSIMGNKEVRSGSSSSHPLAGQRKMFFYYYYFILLFVVVFGCCLLMFFFFFLRCFKSCACMFSQNTSVVGKSKDSSQNMGIPLHFFCVAVVYRRIMREFEFAWFSAAAVCQMWPGLSLL